MRLISLVTSRPYVDIQDSFRRLRQLASFVHFNGAEASTRISQYINLVISERVKSLPVPLSPDVSSYIEEIPCRCRPLWLRIL